MRVKIKTSNVLFVPRIILTLSVISLSLITYYLISKSTNTLLLNNAVTKLTTAQRTLSQQIINSIAADNLEGKIEGPPLQPTINKFISLETFFLNGDSSLNITPLKKSLYADYNQLDFAYKKLLQSISLNLSNDVKGDFISLLNAENFYLQQLDEFVSKLNSYSNDEVRKFKIRETSILMFTLLLIFFEIVFIFLPAVNKIDKQNKVLTEIAFNQAHLIRRPLTNIQSLLSLLSDKKNLDTDADNMINLAASEANALDDIIKQNVQKTSV